MATIYRGTVPKTPPGAAAKAGDGAEPNEIKDAARALDLGRARNQAMDPKGARMMFERALELDPGNDAAAQELAVTLLDAGRADEGLAVLERFLEREPAKTDARLTYARALLRLERLEAACVEAERCARERPGWEQPYVIWVRALCRLDKKDEASLVLTRWTSVSKDPRPAELMAAMIARLR